jgi:hypothetical protein
MVNSTQNYPVFGLFPSSGILVTAECIYSIPCEYGRSYIGETVRPLAVLIRGDRHNF